MNKNVHRLNLRGLILQTSACCGWYYQAELKMKNKFIVLGMLWVLLTLSLIACSASQSIAVDDKIDIYSIAIRQLYEVDRGNKQGFPIIYLVQTTHYEGPSGDKTPILLEEPVKAGITANLDDFFPDCTWVKEYSDANRDGENVLESGIKGGGVTISMGSIHLQEDGSAKVEMSIGYGYLTAEGLTYIVKQVEGIWQIVGYTLRWAT